MKNIIKIFCIFFLLGWATQIYAGDASIEVDFEQEITIDTIDVSSNSGIAEVFVGGIIAQDDSDIRADIESEISVKSIGVSTNSGKASALIGTIIAGN